MNRRVLLMLVLPGLAFIGLLLVVRARLTGLPSVPADLTAERAGLAGLDRMADRARHLEEPLGGEERARSGGGAPVETVERARSALDLIAQGAREEGLRLLGEAVARDPTDLVLGNAYRMAVYRLKRASLAESKERGERTPELPSFLRDEPLALLEAIAGRSPGREVDLQIALAHVDRMVLNPALEIKAPASIDSVRTLSKILEGGSPHYVPALFARGLNYLYRPRSLVWPEHPAPPPYAASRDLSLAAAAGAKVGGAPARLRGLLLLALGDAYAHEGNVGVARSWWVMAREISNDPAMRADIATRMDWTDREVPERLEARLEERMADEEHPASDLSFLWSDTARGPS